MTDRNAIQATYQNLADRGVRRVRFEIPDLMGLARSKTVSIDAFKDFAQHGLNFYGGALGLDTANVVVHGTGIAEELRYRDGLLIPQLETARVLPWKPDSASVICKQVSMEGEELAFGPRAVLSRLMGEAAELGFIVTSGLEYEFFLLDAETRRPVFGGSHLFESSYSHYNAFIDEMLGHLSELGLDVTTHNVEYGAGQFEINFGPGTGLQGADKAFRFKNAVKEMARNAGFIASFMSKPFASDVGNGCHIHIGLCDAKSGQNLFMVKDKSGAMTDLAERFTAGILRHARALLPLISPTPNCFRRLKPHTFAPSRISWGTEDRTAMVRGILTGRPNTHIEVRAGSGMANPYLGVAATLAAGLIGIREKYELAPEGTLPVEEIESNPVLAQSLDQALNDLGADKTLRASLGESFIGLFVTLKREELQRYHLHITDWELNEYLEHF